MVLAASFEIEFIHLSSNAFQSINSNGDRIAGVYRAITGSLGTEGKQSLLPFRSTRPDVTRWYELPGRPPATTDPRSI